MGKKMLLRRFLWYQFPAVVWMIVIFIQSSIPYLSTPDLGFKLHDKLAHIVEFGIFGLLLFRAFFFSKSSLLKKWSHQFTIGIGVIYAIFDEIHQSWVPGRAADKYDVIADIVGLIFVTVIFECWHRKKKKQGKMVFEKNGKKVTDGAGIP